LKENSECPNSKIRFGKPVAALILFTLVFQSGTVPIFQLSCGATTYSVSKIGTGAPLRKMKTRSPRAPSNNNNAYVVWKNASTSYNLAPYRSVDEATTHNGINFAVLTLMKSPANVTNREPEIKVNPYGFVYVIWRTEKNPLTQNWTSVIFIARSEDGGNTFRSIQNITKYSGLAREAKLETSGAEVYAVFRYFNWKQDSFNVYWVGSQNNETTYSSPQKLGAPSGISLNIPTEFLDPQIPRLRSATRLWK
jgi:hypothetical protein